MTFAMARQVVVEMARSFGVRPSRYSGGDRLPHELYQAIIAALEGAGLRWAGGEDAEETLATLRATYEPLLDGLGSALLMPLPGWMAHENATDHWQAGHRGLMAGRLIEQLADRENGAPTREIGPGRLSQRIRARLTRRP